MMFEPSRAKALNQLNNFIDNGLAEYSKLRNFDFGPQKDPIYLAYLHT